MTDEGSEPQLTGRWRKSSHTNQGNCVEFATTAHGIALRNSNHPDAGTLLLSLDEFVSWIGGCKTGEFDDLG
jgi:hypothetical protein